MTRDSLFNATAVLRRVGRVELSEYDLHINVVGGGNIDGPSTGAALFLVIYSALTGKPLRQDVAVSGELSLQGKIKPVGAIVEKLYGAKATGIKEMFLPGGNILELPHSLKGIKVHYVNCVEELLKHILVEGKKDE